MNIKDIIERLKDAAQKLSDAETQIESIQGAPGVQAAEVKLATDAKGLVADAKAILNDLAQ